MQVVLLPLLLCVVSERTLIVAAFGGVLLKLIGLAVAQTKAQVLLSITCGTLYFMAYPSISSIKANSVPSHELGAVQGALSGATALASGVGPLIMNQIFSWSTTAVYMPRVCNFFWIHRKKKIWGESQASPQIHAIFEFFMEESAGWV